MESLRLLTGRKVITAKPEQSVFDVCELMRSNNIGAVVIVRAKKPIGMFSERDLLNRVVAMDKSYKRTKLKDVMITNVTTAEVTVTPEEAYRLMSSKNIRHLPVVKNGNLVGIVSIKDLLQFNFLKVVTKEKIETWMSKTTIMIKATQSVLDVCRLMQKNNIGIVIVVRNKKPIGVFSERDLLNNVVIAGKDYENTKLREVMTTNVVTAHTSTTPHEACNLMSSKNIRHLPVVKNGNLVGIVSIKDLLRFDMRVMEQVVTEQTKELNFLKDLLDKTSDACTKKLLKKINELKDLVMVDDLTKLFNHKCFEEMLKKEITRSKREKRSLCLLFIDIDHFKHYNDINGHERGNVVLKQVADILSNTSRKSDTIFKMLPIDIVARYGGEEFVFILPGTDRKGGLRKARRLLKDIRNYNFYNGEAQPKGKLTISIGIAEYPNDALSWKMLIKQVDKALYKAKETGRDKAVQV